MKAAVYKERSVPIKLFVEDIDIGELRRTDVLIKVLYCGVNPIDYWIASGRYSISPPNNIVGSEAYGVIEDLGDDVEGFKIGDRVIVYPWIYCGKCRYCIEGNENLCLKGGIIGGIVDGCYAEYMVIDHRNVFKVDEKLDEYTAATLPIGALTAYHSVKKAGISRDDIVLVLGASGNVGIYVVQYAKLYGAIVIAISRKRWLKDYGADYVVKFDEVDNLMDELRLKPTVVIDPIGIDTMSKSLRLLDRGGRLVTFGTLTGDEVMLDIGFLYRNEITLLGATGGSRAEFMRVIRDAVSGKLKPKIWRIFKLHEAEAAINSLWSDERDGKILLKPS